MNQKFFMYFNRFDLKTMVQLFFIISVFAVSLSFIGIQQANAAPVTVANGTVLYPDNSAAENVTVEMHNGNGSVSETTTTNSSGEFTFEAEESDLNGQNLTIELRAPDGYNKPENSPYTFTYTTGQSPEQVEFVLILAPKIITVSVTDEKGTGVEQFDVMAVPLSSVGNNGVSTQVSGSTGELNVTGGRWAIHIDRNLSEANRERYPWVAIGRAQIVEFADDESVETATLNFTVIADDARPVVLKPVNADGEILVSNDFNGDVIFECFTKYGAITTHAKVAQDTGLASLYLLPGICKIEGYHNTKLENQSYDPTDTFIIAPGNNELDLGTIAASENRSKIVGTLNVVTTNKSGEFAEQNVQNIHLIATNTDNGRTAFAQTESTGEFTFQNLSAGTYTIAPSDENYVISSNPTIELGADETKNGIEVEVIETTLNINGGLQIDGSAVEDANAVVIATSGDETFSAPVDPETGGYELKMYDTGDDTVELNVVTQIGSEIYAEKSLTVNVDSGSTFTQNIAVDNNEGTITGNVVNFASDANVDESTLGANAEVVAINEDNGSVEKATVDNTGEFSLHVAPGSWKVMTDITDSTANALSLVTSDKSIDVSAGEVKDNIDVPVHVTDGGTVSGSLVDVDGNAVPEARVFITNQPELEKENGGVDPEKIVSVVTQTDAAGDFLQKLPDGTYTAFFSSNPSDEAEMPPKSEEFTIDNSNASIDELAYSEGDTTVSGAVDKKLEDAMVVFAGKDGATVEAEVNDGEYTANLDAGTYTATVSGIKDGYVAYTEREVTVKEKDKEVNFATVAKSEVSAPAGAQTECDASDSCVVTNTAGAQVRLAPYAASLEDSITVSLVPKVNISSAGGYDQVGVMYDVDIRDSNGFAITQLAQPVDITLPLDTDLYDKKIDLNELTPSFRQDSLDMFLSEGVQAIVNKDEMIIKTEHLTPFAITTVDTGVAVPLRPKKLKVIQVKAHKATLQWRRPANTRNVTKYQVQLREYKVKKDAQWKKMVKKNKLRGTKIRKIVKHLEAKTRYQFRVKAVNSAGKGKWSKWKTFKTKK